MVFKISIQILLEEARRSYYQGWQRRREQQTAEYNKTANLLMTHSYSYSKLNSLQVRGYLPVYAITHVLQIQIQIHNFYCPPTYKLYSTKRKYTNNILSTYSDTLQRLAHLIRAKGAGNPTGFMGFLSDTLNLIYLNMGAGGARVQQW